ncbi:WD40 repeat-like protein [Anaeromyces robustus]|uniref:WD40 repeat-like protein n=1 Tax=Anaeromyces robustus TaxID=1754192 RepID=A0A1Y1XP13_9FUNG|nr:WD40 repeat-like protein [Anaeromyces robustus]|eukprot:ORX87064.1 WD40 repeat-like protein [Anaeromyces robustus]
MSDSKAQISQTSTTSVSSATSNSQQTSPQKPSQSEPSQSQSPQIDSTNSDSSSESEDVEQTILKYLRKKGYRNAEHAFMEDLKQNEQTTSTSGPQNESETTNATTIAVADSSTNTKTDNDNSDNYIIANTLNSEKDDNLYEEGYSKLRSWIEGSIDMYRFELRSILYPIFIYSYLDLVSKGKTQRAKQFMEKYSIDHKEQHIQDIQRLSSLSDPMHVKENILAQTFLKNKYLVKLSSASYSLFLAYLQNSSYSILLQITNQYLSIRVSPKALQQSDIDDGIGIIGHQESQIEAFNKQEIHLGNRPYDLFEIEEIERRIKDEKNENNEQLLEIFKGIQEKLNEDPLPKEQVPLPVRKLIDISNDVKNLKDVSKRAKLDNTKLPSICCYTFHNTHHSLNCLSINNDETMICGGFSDSFIRVWSITGKNLRGITKPRNINGNIDNLDRFREPVGSQCKKLIAHSGPIYSTSFSPDNKYLVSVSEDKTIRLWSLDTFSNVVCYKGHNYPVWDVDFSPEGFYFATASHDRTARLWSCDHIYPLRIFVGHFSDVDSVKFHPNSNYIVTGGSDCTARLWDIQKGTCVRIFKGHLGPIYALAVTPDGKTLATSGDDKIINIWDIGSGRKIKSLHGHENTVNSLSFSQEGSILASGSSDNTVRLWDVKKDDINELDIIEQASSNLMPNSNSNAMDIDGGTISPTQLNNTINKTILSNKEKLKSKMKNDLLGTYPTKKTPIYTVHFSRRNLLYSLGAINNI